MKKLLSCLLFLFAASAFGQNGPQIPLSGSIGVPGSSPTLCSSHVVLSSDANYTLTANQYACNTVTVTSSVALTATRTITAPQTYGQQFTFTNATTGGQALIVSGGSGSTVTVPNGSTAIINDVQGAGYVGTSNAGSLGITGIPYANGSSAATVATIAQIGTALSDINNNYLIENAIPLAGWPLPFGTNAGSNVLEGSNAGRNIYDFSALTPQTATASAASGSTQLAVTSAPTYGVGWVANGAGIPTNDPVLNIAVGNLVNLQNPTTAALSSESVTFTYAAAYTNGLVAIGEGACQSCYTNNGSVVIGTGALANDKGFGGGGEDQNGVFIGPFAGAGETGYDCIYGITFESILIGNKSGATGCGWNDTIMLGNHIYNISGSRSSVFVGGESNPGGTGTTNVQFSPSSVVSVGYSNFSPSAVSLPSPASGNYSTSNAICIGNRSCAQLFGAGSQDNINIGTNAFNGSSAGGPITGKYNASVGDNDFNGLTSGSYNAAFGGFVPSSGLGGNSTLQLLSSGLGNSAFGNGALGHISTTNYSSGFGYLAGQNATVPIDAFGYAACDADVTGNGDLCIGNLSGQSLTGSANVIIGPNYSGPSGNYNYDSEFGYQVGRGDNSSSETLLGFEAGYISGGGTILGNNTAVGAGAMSGADSGNEYDSLFGAGANCNGCTSSEAIGYDAVIAAVSGAAQIGTGTNSLANTLQFRSWNFLTSAGAATFSSLAVGGGATLASTNNICQTSGTNCPAYAPLASPAFTGTPTAPTAATGTNTTQLATTAFTNSAILAATKTMSFVWGDDGNTTPITTSNTVYGFWENMYSGPITVTEVDCYSNDGTATVTVGYGTGSNSNVGTIVTGTACANTGTKNTGLAVSVPAGDVLNFVPTGGSSARVSVMISFHQ